MKKILILTNSSGGLYDFRMELVERLLERHKVTVSVPDTVRVKELAEEGCKVVHTPIHRRGVNPIEDIKLVFAYRRLIQEEEPDLVLTYTIKPNIYGGFCCARMKIPYVATVTGLGSTFQKKGLLRTMIVYMYRASLKKAECIFFQNRENQGVFEQYAIFGKKVILVKGSGVNLRRHKPAPYPKGGKIIFLYIGRMMKEKGIEELLEAAKELHDKNTEFQLLGYCDEDYQDKLNEWEEKGWITQLGFDPYVQKYLRNASALVLPTYHEGMSNVLMEASATARPVIATNISGCKEIFEEGVTGLGCKPRSSQDLIRVLVDFRHLSPEERERMGLAAREKMEREFDREKIVNIYMDEILNILRKKDEENDETV